MREHPVMYKETKVNGRYVRDDCPTVKGAFVWRCLAIDLINRKENNVKSVRRTDNDDGTRTFVITYDDGTRSHYDVSKH